MARIKGTSANNSLSGDQSGVSEKDSIYGYAGNDTLNGLAGNDTIDGGDGNDTLNGGDGNDKLVGGKGIDTLNGGNDNDTMLGGYDNDALNGNAGADYMDGGSGNDNLQGGSENDTLIGGAGDDTLNGGDGDDTMFAGSGIDAVTGGNGTADVISWADATEGVSASMDASGSGTGGAQSDTWVTVEGMTGSRFNDTLVGGATISTVLKGGAGNDTLTLGAIGGTLQGDAGNDELTGAAGLDKFVAQYDQGLDRFENFRVAGADVIQISDVMFKLTSTSVGNALNTSAVEFGTSHLAAGSADVRFIFETDTKILWCDLDGTGTEYGSVALAVIDDLATPASAAALAAMFEVIA